MKWNIYAQPEAYSYTGCLELLGNIEASTAEDAISKGQERWKGKVYRVNGPDEVRYVDQSLEGYTRSTIPYIK